MENVIVLFFQFYRKTQGGYYSIKQCLKLFQYKWFRYMFIALAVQKALNITAGVSQASHCYLTLYNT